MTEPSVEQYADWIARYRRDLNRFIRDMWQVEPDTWQAEVANWLAKDEHRYICVPSGHGTGKGHPVDWKVPSPQGEKRWGDLRAGDWLFGTSGRPTRILDVYDRGKLPTYRVLFDDGSWTQVDAEHRWMVRRRERKGAESRVWGSWQTLSTADLIAIGVTRPNGSARVRQWQVPGIMPVQYPEQSVPVAPYTLGVWLGDGTSQEPRITSTDPEMPEWIEQDSGTRVTVAQYGTRAPTLSVSGLAVGLRALNLLGCGVDQKRVPLSYRENAEPVRLAVLQGLMDTDGTVGKHTQSPTFCSTSQGLVEDVMWLVRSLGGKAQAFTTKRPWYRLPDGSRQYCRPAYQTTVRLPEGMPLFRLARKQSRVQRCEDRYVARFISAIEPAEETDIRCVRVAAENQLYLTNDFIPTHNTALLSWSALWFLLTRFPCKIPLTAPSGATLEDGLMAEIKTWIARLPVGIQQLLEVQMDRVFLKAAPERAFITARTARAEKPDALQGQHADYVLLIVDEASGVPDAVFEASHGSMSGPARFMMICGNPLRAQGFFYEAQTVAKDAPWKVRTVSCLEAKRAPQSFIDEIREMYGEDSNVYRTRVLGLPPKADEDTIVPLDLVQDAVGRDVHLVSTAPIIWGLDVARLGKNQSALAKRQGNWLLETVTRYSARDTMQLVGSVAAEYHGLPEKHQPMAICVDAIGIGAPVVDRLRELGLPAVGINVSEHKAISDEFWNLKGELWWKAKGWFAARDCKMPADPELVRALTVVRVHRHSTGKLMVEPKDHLEKRCGARLPRLDAADAFVLTFGYGSAQALFGRSMSQLRRHVIKRNLVGIV